MYGVYRCMEPYRYMGDVGSIKLCAGVQTYREHTDVWEVY